MNDAVIAYRSAMAVALGLLDKSLITQEEYCEISSIIANKYNLDLCTISCQNPLILPTFRANIAQTTQKVVE